MRWQMRHGRAAIAALLSVGLLVGACAASADEQDPADDTVQATATATATPAGDVEPHDCAQPRASEEQQMSENGGIGTVHNAGVNTGTQIGAVIAGGTFRPSDGTPSSRAPGHVYNTGVNTGTQIDVVIDDPTPAC